MIAMLFERLRQHDRNALARLVSLAARGEALAEIHSALAGIAAPPPDGTSASASVIAFTGSGGVGKSSLLGQLLRVVRSQGPSVAVLACDPQSPLSGGALLGDRFRMGSPVDDGVFIRSLAAASGHDGLAEHLEVMIRLLEAFRFDVIFLETVGSGQGDVAVRDLADAVVLLVQPESGDDVQWEKAGILECADLVVVHKADLPTAAQTAAQVRSILALSPGRDVPVLLVSSRSGQGLDALWQALQALPRRRSPIAPLCRLWHDALEQLEQRFRAALQRQDPALNALARHWPPGTPAPPDVRALLRILLPEDES